MCSIWRWSVSDEGLIKNITCGASYCLLLLLQPKKQKKEKKEKAEKPAAADGEAGEGGEGEATCIWHCHHACNDNSTAIAASCATCALNS
jgi:hypothetical protein